MQTLKKLFDLIDQWRGHYIFASLLILLGTLVRLFEPKVLQVTIDTMTYYINGTGALPHESADQAASLIYQILPSYEPDVFVWILMCLGGIFLIVSLLRGLTNFGGGVLKSLAVEGAIKKLRDRLFKHIQLLPLSYHDTNKTGELIQRCTGDVSTIYKFMMNHFFDVIRLFAVFFISFIFMALVDLSYALWSVCLLPLIFLSSYLFFKKVQKVWDKHEAESDKLTSVVSENLAGIRVVKAFAQQDAEIAKFDKQNTATREIGLKKIRLEAIFWPFSDLIVHLQVGLSLMIGGYYALNGYITIGEMVSFYTYAAMITWPMQRLGRLISQLGMFIVAMERIETILEAQPEDYTGTIELAETLDGNIVFDKVSFTYPTGEEVLKDVSFEIKAGEKVAIVGAAGSGKSTLIKLLTRFYEPTKGQILLDKKPLETYGKTDLRNRLGVALQRSFLFSDTIKNNIAYTQQEASEEEIIAAAKTSDIHQVMHVFPSAYDTFVGEKGVSLSGGQKQRVALARTVLEKPDILILDDATSAVDTATEHRIQTALQKEMRQKTSIVIAHRITSIQHADRIMVMNNGQVEAFDTSKNLLKQNAFYQKIYSLQVSLEEDIKGEI